MYPERGTTAVINLHHLAHNIGVFKSLHSGPIIGVVKADAYGHGLARVSEAVKACDALAVATIEEALQLRTFAPDIRIILLEGVFNDIELELAIEKQLDVVVHQAYQIELMQQSDLKGDIDVWLKVDTGMHRLGFAWSDYPSTVKKLKKIPMLKKLRLMAHFAQSGVATADQTRQQHHRNQTLMQHGFEYSFANTGAVLNGLHQTGEWARVGIGLYGISPIPDTCGADYDLRPVMQLTANIIALKTFQAGEAIGYGAEHRCERSTLVGIVGIGYGDGYPWSREHSQVAVHGRKVAVIGQVSMDKLAIDLTDIIKPQVGDLVQLWGATQAIEQVASDVGVIPYTLVCGVTNRVNYDVIS